MAKETHGMAAGKPPITRHPLFPAVVALWFGALFGIGSLAIRPSLIESAVGGLGIDSVFAAAAPPLGATARILIALMMAGVGGLLGAMLARRIGRPKPVARQRRRSAVPARGAPEERNRFPLFEQPEAPAAQSGRRGQLTSRHDQTLASDHLDRAPVPGNSQILDVSQFGLEGFDPAAEQPAEPAASEEPAPFSPPPGDEAPVEFAALNGAQVNEAAAMSTLPRLGAGIDPAEPTAPAAQTGGRSLFDRTHAGGAFTQPFNAKVSQVRWQDEPAATPAPAKEAPKPDESEAPLRPAQDASAAERIASSDLDELCPIELLERLAISLRRKRERASATALAASAEPEPSDLAIGSDDRSPADTPSPVMTEHGEPEEEADDAPVAPLAPPIPVIPAALRPVGIFPEDDEDDVPSYVPPRHIRANPASSVAPGGQSAPGNEAELDEGYSSLLNLSRPAQSDHRFVRVEEPEPLASDIEPVVVFPGQEPAGLGPFARPAEQPKPQPAASAAEAESSGDAHSAAMTSQDRPEPAPPNPAAPTPPFAPPAAASDPQETERALRAALANIQRMSGAA